MAWQGVPTGAIKTRMAKLGVIDGGGRVDHTPADLDGALGLAGELGYERVALLGYGLGATMVAHHQALRRPAAVEAVCTLAHPASLPEALRDRWRLHGSSPGYEQMLERAGRRAAGGDQGDDIVVVTRGSGYREAPCDTEVWTERTWWASRSPQATHAVSRERVPHMSVPLGIIQPSSDVEIGYGAQLAAAAGEAGVPKGVIGAGDALQVHRDAALARRRRQLAA